MLADELDYVIGVDPHRDTHASRSSRCEAAVWCSRRPRSQMARVTLSVLRLADQHAPGRRAFAVEGTGSFGAGLARFLVSHQERVLEVGRLPRERQSGKNDALDAIRAARSVLGQNAARLPRAGGEREALRVLRRCSRRRGDRQTRPAPPGTPLAPPPPPEPLRAELRSLTRAQLLRRLAAVRPERRQDPELRGTLGTTAWPLYLRGALSEASISHAHRLGTIASCQSSLRSWPRRAPAGYFPLWTLT